MNDHLHSENKPDITLNYRSLVSDLLNDGRLTAEDADSLSMKVRRPDQKGWHPVELLGEEAVADASMPGKKLTIEALVRWLSEKSEQPFKRIDPLKIDAQVVTKVMSSEFAQRHGILAVGVDDTSVEIVSAEPYVSSWEATIGQSQPGKRIVRFVANPADIRRYSAEFYTIARSVSQATAQGFANNTLSNLETMLELGELDGMEASDGHIVNIVDWLLQYAFTQRASDIHIEPRREKGKVRFRIDGVLHTVYELPSQIVAAVVSRVKSLGRMDVAEKRRPQDGRLKTRTPEGNEVELRLSSLPTANGEKMVMRVFDPDILLKSFSDLGLANEDYRQWEALVKNPNGIVLVTGPTGSGKTTTLYSSLKKLATSEVNVCSIEDPIEMVESAFNQMQVHQSIGLTFSEGVRALLRQDPDIIMVGEIRDLETAEMAIQAALTGHLVISTLHTSDAPSAITRLLELGIAPYLIKATLLGVMAQRLVRTLCPSCSRSVAVDEDAWKLLVSPFKAKVPKQMQVPVGCLECRDTGYLGREGIYELLTMTDEVKNLVSGDMDLAKLRRTAMKGGMRTLRLSGALKVAAGETTINEVLRVAPLTSVE